MWNGRLRFEDAFIIFNNKMHNSLRANNVHKYMDHVETVCDILFLIDVCGDVSSLFFPRVTVYVLVEFAGFFPHHCFRSLLSCGFQSLQGGI